MSAFTEYSAYVERNTAVNRHTATDLLEEHAERFAFPVSGDMLAVLKEDTRTRQYRRRLAFAMPETEGTL